MPKLEEILDTNSLTLFETEMGFDEPLRLLRIGSSAASADSRTAPIRDPQGRARRPSAGRSSSTSSMTTSPLYATLSRVPSSR